MGSKRGESECVLKDPGNGGRRGGACLRFARILGHTQDQPQLDGWHTPANTCDEPLRNVLMLHARKLRAAVSLVMACVVVFATAARAPAACQTGRQACRCSCCRGACAANSSAEGHA